MTRRTCSADSCDRLVQGRGLCPKHYKAWRRSEGLTACTVEGCGESAISRGWCERHYVQWRRTGNPGPAVRDVGYAAIHYRLRAWRGDASEHPCWSCGALAAEWAYDHLDPAERYTTTGWPFSLDLSHYGPLCKPCHVHLDRKPKSKG